MLKQYLDDITADLNRKSERIRQFYATHAPSAGSGREDLVANLLKDHILPLATVGSGLVMSAGSSFSNQSDVVLYDPFSNGPLFRQSPVPIWLLEAVFGLMEVKTQLTPTTIRDSVAKCRRFKQMPKNYDDAHGRQKITDHLFILWSFGAPANAIAKRNLLAELASVPQSEQPDLIVVPGRFIIRGGRYYELSESGQVNSAHYQQRLASVGGDVSKLVIEPFKMLDLGTNSLTAFLYWLNSWLYAAGPRRPNLLAYYDIESWGHPV